MKGIKVLLCITLGIIAIPAFIFAFIVWCFVAPIVYLFKNKML